MVVFRGPGRTCLPKKCLSVPIFGQHHALCIKSMRLHVYQESSDIAFFLSFIIYVLLIVAVAEPGRIEALQLLRCGFQQTPIYGSVNHLRKAEGILKFGYPPSDIIILYEGFVVCYDTNKKISKWIAYHLTPADLDGNFCSLSAVSASNMLIR